MDTFQRWLAALEQRHLGALTFPELRRSVQALSSLYVERRPRLDVKAAFGGSGKRAAFATYFAPLHFLLIREIIRALPKPGRLRNLLDLGCGTGVAGAAWAGEMTAPPRVIGVDRSAWATAEARWTYGLFGLSSSTQTLNLDTWKLPADAAVIAAFTINELSDEGRERWRHQLLEAGRRGQPCLVVEPIARRLTPWWDDWTRDWVAAGGTQTEWRFRLELPGRLALLDKAAGLDHRELTARSLWFSGE
jgi:hypothetical protein